MKIAYIAGPYGNPGTGYNIIEKRIQNARDCAIALAEKGWGYFCPHLNSAHFEAILPNIPSSYWYELDNAILMRAADAIVMLPDWMNSTGACRELELAETKGLDIFYDVDEVPDLSEENT